jgi:hypothetical protein
MGRKSIKQEKAHKPCQECEHWAEVRDRLRVSGILKQVIAKMELKLQADEYKPSLADFLKLVQLEKEFGDEETQEIRVTWVEPEKSST